GRGRAGAGRRPAGPGCAAMWPRCADRRRAGPRVGAVRPGGAPPRQPIGPSTGELPASVRGRDEGEAEQEVLDGDVEREAPSTAGTTTNGTNSSNGTAYGR